MFQEHARHAIWNQGQHPYKHTLADFSYTNPAMPGVTNVESAFNWFAAVMYPQTKPAVATPAALPAVGNTLNDYRVVYDDGDGKAASYRWEQREGEVAASWHKVYDMDWGADSVFSAYLNVTQDLYVWKQGRTDVDSSGSPITGLYAGQVISGGILSGENLTLRANSGDGVGAHTGFVQVDDNFRPTVHNTYNLGESAKRFKDGYIKGSLFLDTMTLSAGSIVDSSGAISFGSTNLSTTGTLASGAHTVSGTLVLGTGSIVDSGGAISFGSNNLSTAGNIDGAIGTFSSQVKVGILLAQLHLAAGSITDDSGAISFGSNNLSTTGTLGAGNITGTRLDADNIRLDLNTISILNLNGNLILQANGTGVVDIQSPMTTLGQVITGTESITGQLNIDNLRLDGNVISSTNLNGNISLAPNGTGIIDISASMLPSSDGTLNLGASTSRFSKVFISSAISDGTTEISQSVLQSFRDANTGVTAGMTLFWNGSEWLPSLPDTEITHGSLSGLLTGDAGHTQFVMLTGRSGGQVIQGGVNASEDLVLESTSNVTKGLVLFKDTIAPFTNATFSGSWSGTDLGTSANQLRDVVMRGELRGARFENFLFGSLPASSAQNIGRQAFVTDQQKVYVDTGAGWKVAGVSKFDSDIVMSGVVEVTNVDVSANITDARHAVWQLLDNANDFERIYCIIKATSSSNVQIVTHGALPAGSYRLIGLE